jgi:hypothetical protein
MGSTRAACFYADADTLRFVYGPYHFSVMFRVYETRSNGDCAPDAYLQSKSHGRRVSGPHNHLHLPPRIPCLSWPNARCLVLALYSNVTGRSCRLACGTISCIIRLRAEGSNRYNTHPNPSARFATFSSPPLSCVILQKDPLNSAFLDRVLHALVPARPLQPGARHRSFSAQTVYALSVRGSGRRISVRG